MTLSFSTLRSHQKHHLFKKAFPDYPHLNFHCLLCHFLSLCFVFFSAFITILDKSCFRVRCLSSPCKCELLESQALVQIKEANKKLISDCDLGCSEQLDENKADRCGLFGRGGHRKLPQRAMFKPKPAGQGGASLGSLRGLGRMFRAEELHTQ